MKRDQSFGKREGHKSVFIEMNFTVDMNRISVVVKKMLGICLVTVMRCKLSKTAYIIAILRKNNYMNIGRRSCKVIDGQTIDS